MSYGVYVIVQNKVASGASESWICCQMFWLIILCPALPKDINDKKKKEAMPILEIVFLLLVLICLVDALDASICLAERHTSVRHRWMQPYKYELS